MDKRIARAVAVAALAAVPLLGGCGTGSATSEGSAAPAPAAPPASSQAPASATASPAPSASADTAQNTAQDKKQVEAATEKFVKAVLTIGYPDKTFDEYTDRIKPLMTGDGFDALESDDTIKQGSSALKSLYAQKARSAPQFGDDVKVLSLETGRASAQLDYENVAQQKQSSDWKTLKSLGKGTVTVKLVKDGSRWLVEDAS